MLRKIHLGFSLHSFFRPFRFRYSQAWRVSLLVAMNRPRAKVVHQSKVPCAKCSRASLKVPRLSWEKFEVFRKNGDAYWCHPPKKKTTTTTTKQSNQSIKVQTFGKETEVQSASKERVICKCPTFVWGVAVTCEDFKGRNLQPRCFQRDIDCSGALTLSFVRKSKDNDFSVLFSIFLYTLYIDHPKNI